MVNEIYSVRSGTSNDKLNYPLPSPEVQILKWEPVQIWILQEYIDLFIDVISLANGTKIERQGKVNLFVYK